MNYEDLKNEIERAPVITIFRHTNPDCDAVGSQFGLKYWISDNYPEKKVYACGNEEPNQGVWPHADHVDDTVIAQSLAIVLDTANSERVDDSRFENSSRVIRVDHHPDREPFGDESLVEEKAAATCEILSRFIRTCPDCHVSRKTAEALYAGLLTDTLNYTTSNTTAATLYAGALLCEFGVDIPRLARTLFDKSLNGFRFSSVVRSKAEIQNEHLAYEILPCEEMEKAGMSASKARSFIDELGHVRDFEIWCIFTEKKNDDGMSLYDGSLRSKTVVMNDVAAMFHGGGHKNACGVKNLSRSDIDHLLSLLNQKIVEKNA